MLHVVTKRQLDSLAADLPHAVLLTGIQGVGVDEAATYLGEKLSLPVEWVYPEKKEVIDREQGTVTIDIVRRLYDQTKTKAARPRIIAIDKAETMTRQAQNAFLKLLEEPNDSVHFVLVVEGALSLLPTILSRTQRVDVRPLTREQSIQLLSEVSTLDERKRTQIIFLAEGRSAELKQLATDEEYFSTQTGLVKDARTLLQGSSYEKLQVSHSYKDDRTQALKLLELAMKLLESTLQKSGDDASVRRLRQLLDTYEAITRNGNIRLQLSALVV